MIQNGIEPIVYISVLWQHFGAYIGIAHLIITDNFTKQKEVSLAQGIGIFPYVRAKTANVVTLHMFDGIQAETVYIRLTYPVAMYLGQYIQ